MALGASAGVTGLRSYDITECGYDGHVGMWFTASEFEYSLLRYELYLQVGKH